MSVRVSGTPAAEGVKEPPLAVAVAAREARAAVCSAERALRARTVAVPVCRLAVADTAYFCKKKTYLRTSLGTYLI